MLEVSTSISPTTSQQATIPTSPPTLNQPAIQNEIQNVVYASFWQRFFATLLDALIIAVLSLIVSLVIALIFGVIFGSSGNNIAAFISSLLQNIIYFGYFIYFIGSSGQTLGKMALKIKVVKEDTNLPPGYISALLREMVGKVISSVVFGIGYFWMLKDPKKQTWHDKIAKTIVIKV